MRYFIDTEFHEYHKQQKCLGIKVGKPIPTIDLISIGIVSEAFLPSTDPANGKFGEPSIREYYAISKDFNIKDAWNSYQLQEPTPYEKYNGFSAKKEYWLRDNVLKPIFIELMEKEREEYKGGAFNDKFNLNNFIKLINKYGKTNKQIAKEIIEFTTKGIGQKALLDNEIEFYAYYADYDWVVFAQLFGKMIDLPKGFPMYCRDLKQMLDEKLEKTILPVRGYIPNPNLNLDTKLKEIKSYRNYPKQYNEHSALYDAIWNKDLYEFINQLK